MSEPVIGSYVHHNGKCWNVSTIYRESSSPFAIGKYYETLVWEYDAEKRERGKWVHQAEGLDSHFNICRHLIMHGTFPQE